MSLSFQILIHTETASQNTLHRYSGGYFHAGAEHYAYSAGHFHRSFCHLSRCHTLPYLRDRLLCVQVHIPAAVQNLHEVLYDDKNSKENDKAEQGEQLGFIKFGSRVDIFLPLDAEIKVKLHQEVRGTQTVLASLK